MNHVACSISCAQMVVAEGRAKKAQKEMKARREALKTRSDWLKEAQAAFNSFIRKRDEKLPCISCGRFHTGSYDAGHYRSVGAMSFLRFDEANCHKQCVPCNQFKSGNILEYRLGLIKKIGQAAVDYLENDHPPLALRIEEIKAIKATYKAKLRELEAHEDDNEKNGHVALLP